MRTVRYVRGARGGCHGSRDEGAKDFAGGGTFYDETEPFDSSKLPPRIGARQLVAVRKRSDGELGLPLSWVTYEDLTYGDVVAGPGYKTGAGRFRIS